MPFINGIDDSQTLQFHDTVVPLVIVKLARREGNRMFRVIVASLFQYSSDAVVGGISVDLTWFCWVTLLCLGRSWE